MSAAKEINEFQKRIEEVKMPEKVRKEAEKQLKRLEKMHPDSAEAATIRTYLEWMVELPWSKKSKDNLDIKAAKKVLDKDHYDLEKVKERILEYLAVRKMKEKMKGPILCFVGPPGVGKTSLGRSIARALGREFVRISLGGVRDEAEIGAPPYVCRGAAGPNHTGNQAGGCPQSGLHDGRNRQGRDGFPWRSGGGPARGAGSEQNGSFSDHYLGVPFDLSEVLFITTANLIDPILAPLRDRMEIIELSGYTEEEKLGIARHFLVNRQLSEHGITEKNVHLTDATMRLIISQYTREAGVPEPRTGNRQRVSQGGQEDCRGKKQTVRHHAEESPQIPWYPKISSGSGAGEGRGRGGNRPGLDRNRRRHYLY